MIRRPHQRSPILRPRRTLASTAALTLILLGGAPAQAQAGTQLRYLQGSCETLLVSGRSASRGCRPNLVNLTYPSGAMSFVFTDSTGRLISFFGRVAHRAGSQATIKVGQITLVPRGSGPVRRIPAIGSCVLTPFTADRARLECAARGQSGTYSALFKTSGKGRPPVTL